MQAIAKPRAFMWVLPALAVVGLANAFAVHYIGQERFVYFWDTSGYWIAYKGAAVQFLREPVRAASHVFRSMQTLDYNLLPVVSLLPAHWAFGGGRLPYILAITNLYLLPAAFVLALLTERLYAGRGAKLQPGAVVFGAMAIVMLHTLWTPALRGLPDVMGIAILGVILWLQADAPMQQQSWRRLVLTGLLMGALVLTRRWYLFWAISFFAATLLAHGLELRSSNHWPADVRRLVSNLALTSAVFAVTFVVIAQPLVRRIVHTDYGDIYSAYRRGESLLQIGLHTVLYFGIGIVATAVVGWVLMFRRGPDARRFGLLAIAQLLIVFVLFARTQDFGVQHYYLLTPAVAIGLVTVVVWAWHSGRPLLWRAAAMGLVLTIVLASSVQVFAISQPAAGLWSVLAPRELQRPLVRDDLDSLDRLLSRIQQLGAEHPGNVYVLASSMTLNSSVVSIACQLNAKWRTLCPRILRTHDVDKRDGFPDRLLEARYVVVATPTQYHLNPEDQRVIGLPAEAFVLSKGIGSSFVKLPDAFEFEHGVTAYLYEKRRPIEAGDVRALSEQLAQYYPDHRELFSPSSAPASPP